jgi:predicted acylesterase/phospholipase RssA
MRFRGFGALFKPGLYRGDPLRKLVRQSLSPSLISAVAREHSKGRRLYIATVSLDAQRQVVWDAGELARRGDPASLKMLEDILVASASVPGVFPPVLIRVQNGINAVIEMHVDGGAVSNFFIWPEDFPIDSASKGRLSRVFVVLNSRVEPNFSVVQYGGIKIASRSFETMQKYSTSRQLKYIENVAGQRGIYLSIAEIPAEYSSGFLDFSRDRMTDLFNQGAELGKSGRAFLRSDRAGK